MQVKQTKLQDIIEGTKQYVIHVFQRTYSWTSKDGYFIEMNLSAQSIERLCHQAMEIIKLTSDDWSI